MTAIIANVASLAPSYATKATAVRGATRANLAADAYSVSRNEDGRFVITLVEKVKAKKEKAPKERSKMYKELYSRERSTVIKPFNVVHSFLDANPDMKRKDAITALIEQGVNFSTARTQYQRWFTKNKRGGE